jgi:hypothetical protein
VAFLNPSNSTGLNPDFNCAEFGTIKNADGRLQKNSNFNYGEFAIIKSQAGLPNFNSPEFGGIKNSVGSNRLEYHTVNKNAIRATVATAKHFLF